MSDYFDRVEQHLLDAVERHADHRSGWGARRHRLRSVRWQLSAVLTVVLVLGSVGIAGVFLSAVDSHHRPPAPSAAGRSGCGIAGAQRQYRQGPPSSLLSILGVLRRPAGAQDRPAPRIITTSARGQTTSVLWADRVPRSEWSTARGVGYPYRAYVRRARTYDGLSFWVAPVVSGADVMHSDRCLRPLIGMALASVEPGGAATGGCCTNAADIRDGGGAGTSTIPGHGTILDFLVPDVVATVTLRFPVGPSHRLITQTIRPIGNVVAIRFPPADTNDRVRKAIWRDAGGQIIHQGK